MSLQHFIPVRQSERGSRGQVAGSAGVRRVNETGLTLVELIVTVSILTILAMAAFPLVRFQVKRQRERELRYDLWMMRDAIVTRWSTASTFRARSSSSFARFRSIP
jgi:prepilin-type N-terminal cleavage/methylation domain-containing protein